MAELSRIKLTSTDPETGDGIEIVVKGIANMPFWKNDLKIKAAIALLDHIDIKDFEDYDAPKSLLEEIKTLHEITTRIKDESPGYRNAIGAEYLIHTNEARLEKENGFFYVESIISNMIIYADGDNDYQPTIVVTSSLKNNVINHSVNWRDASLKMYLEERLSPFIEKAKQQNEEKINVIKGEN